MGLILDSSVIIDAERRRETVEQLIQRLSLGTGDQDVAISAVGLTELIHGLYRSAPPERRINSTNFLNELVSVLTVHPFTKETALLAGRIGGEQRHKGIVIPFPDLLIGVTALTINYGVLTLNLRDFERIPGLTVVKLQP
jgi:predicted nucleic acid-binding protein